MPAGKNTYIVIGKAEKDGPGYKILLKDGKSISLAATSKTEMHPYWIKPEKLPKVFVKYVNDMGMYQALQIYDAKNSFIDKKWSKNSGYLYSIEKNKKTEQSK